MKLIYTLAMALGLQTSSSLASTPSNYNLSTWMTDIYYGNEKKADIKLNQMVIPGSHDSFAISSDPSGIEDTQKLSISQQLDIGIRYLDLRVKKHAGEVITYHGKNYNNLHDILNAVQKFVEKNSKEIVIVNIKSAKSVLGDFTFPTAEIQSLLDGDEGLQKQIIKWQDHRYFRDVTYKDLADDGGIIILSKDTLNIDNERATYPNSDIVGNYNDENPDSASEINRYLTWNIKEIHLLWAEQHIITPDFGDAVEQIDPTGWFSDSLYDMHNKQVEGRSVWWMAGHYAKGHRSNVVITDFVDDDFTAEIISYNQLPSTIMSTYPAEHGDNFGGALATGDFNGDNYDDLVISSPDEDAGDGDDLVKNVGVVSVFFGSENGLSPLNHFNSRQTTWGGGESTNDRYGQVLSVGDFNNDGLDDIAIGIPQEDVISGSTRHGGVRIIYGTEDSGFSTKNEATNQSLVTWIDEGDLDFSPEGDDQFGYSLAASDFDGDGHDDLAIGVPFEDHGSTKDVGYIHIIFGSINGFDLNRTQHINPKILSEYNHEAEDRFGEVLAAGYIDGDELADLVIGVPYKNRDGKKDSGVVIVLKGKDSKLSTDAEYIDGSASSTGHVESEDKFGSSLALANFFDNQKHYSDIVIGIPFENLGAYDGHSEGEIMVVKNGDSNQAEVFSQRDFNGNPESGDQFGSYLAAGDIDGDGKDDIIVGVPNEDGSYQNDGWTGVLSSKDPHDPSLVVRLSQSDPFIAGSREKDDYFGRRVATGDFNGDGYNEIVISSTGEDIKNAPHNDNEGIVDVIYSSKQIVKPGVEPRYDFTTQRLSQAHRQ